jgi:hypothetical protein
VPLRWGIPSRVPERVYPHHSLLEANKAEVMKSEIKWWRRYIEKSTLKMILDHA